MTDKDFYKFYRDQQNKANKLAREVIVTARERKVSIPALVRSLCENYAGSEADVASQGAYDGGYARGVSDGRNAERLGW